MIQSKTILNAIPKALQTISIPELEEKHQGKVRDFYILPDKRITITTDRQSAFDLNIGIVPFKGAVLNQLASFWFEKTKHILPNHLISIPDPNVLISKNCEPIPVEMVVRGYLSGVANTSIWYSYEKGEREIYGITFPDGMHKNQKLPTNIITPTTHPAAGSGKHDERLTREEIIKQKIIDKTLYEQMEKVSLELFAFGQKWCERHGLILVDTKYEFGLYKGQLMLIDEIHTPDSSRFWIAKTYKERIAKGLEPENFDKEFIRLWYAKKVNPYKDKVPPMSKELIVQASQRYIKTYEMLTDKKFSVFEYPIEERIRKNIKKIEDVKLDQKRTTIDKLGICKQTRKIAADSLYTVLKKLLNTKKPISEVMLRDAWLTEMQKNKNIFPEGWYQPPPHGMIVLFADDQNVERINYKSARPEDKWPRDDIFLSPKNGLIYCYASPVDKKTGIIGDFGVTLYFGKNKEIQKLLQLHVTLDKEIFDFAQKNMQLLDIASFAEKLFTQMGLSNEIVSRTDKNVVNIGHSVPASYEEWDQKEKNILKTTNNWNQIKDMISDKRAFVNTKETLTITPPFAATIEPREKIVAKPYLPTSLSYHTIALFKKDGSKELLTNFDELFTLAGMSYMIKPMKQQKQKITYSQVGDNYDTKDPIKIHAQKAARATGKNLLNRGFEEVSDSRGESAYVWKQGGVYMASVVEGLGTKNLIADGTRKFTKKTHYDAIAHDTVATIINDLVTVGAQPLVVHAYWAIEDNEWLADEERMKDLIDGWKSACDLAGASWGGGETATMKQIVVPNTCELAGSAIGIIKNKKRLVTDKKLKSGDRILLIKSNGVNANGISLTRAIANNLPKGYATKLKDGITYGEALLAKSNIYAKLIQDLLDANIDIHYISNITGHGLRKIMRARPNFTYMIENILEPQEIFNFIQKHAGLTDYEMYDTYNMGMDYAIFLPKNDIKNAQAIVRKNKFESIDAGFIEKGERKVVIKPKNITFTDERLKVRE